MSGKGEHCPNLADRVLEIFPRSNSSKWILFWFYLAIIISYMKPYMLYTGWLLTYAQSRSENVRTYVRKVATFECTCTFESCIFPTYLRTFFERDCAYVSNHP